VDNHKDYIALKEFCQDLGADLFGVADTSKIKGESNLSKKILGKINRAVSLGMRLSETILEEIEGAPTRLYFHHYRTINDSLDQLALKVCNYIQKKGYSALPVPASQIIEWQSLQAHISHRRIGYLAGLGWIGRNNLLVNKSLGSHFRLVSILTNVPLEADKPTREDCGDCRVCIESCPAGAIKEELLDFQQEKCFQKLREFQKRRSIDQYICGVCVKSCKGERE